MYRKDQTETEVNIRNVSVDKDFYGKDADDKITKIEVEFARLLDELRAYPQSGPIIDLRVSKLVAHLCVRTRQLRQTTVEALQETLQRLRDDLIKIAIPPAVIDTPEGQDLLKARLVAEGIPANRITQAMLLRRPHLLRLAEQNMPDLAVFVDKFISTVLDQFPESLKTAHNEALSKNPIAELRADSYAQLNWYVVIAKSPVILGDTVCVFETRGQRRFKPLNDQDDDVKQILLPVAGIGYLSVHRPPLALTSMSRF